MSSRHLRNRNHCTSEYSRHRTVRSDWARATDGENRQTPKKDKEPHLADVLFHCCLPSGYGGGTAQRRFLPPALGPRPSRRLCGEQEYLYTHAKAGGSIDSSVSETTVILPAPRKPPPNRPAAPVE